MEQLLYTQYVKLLRLSLDAKSNKMDYLKINKNFWNKWSQERGPWSCRVSKEQIQKARAGKVEFSITTSKPVPKNWKGLDVLGLAAGGGQQMPIVAAAGANVTSFDFSEEQLKRDLEVCKEEGLKITTQKGEMEDLSVFPDESFDFVINPVSICFTKNVKKVWKEIYRVLRTGGSFITAFDNPIAYSLDSKAYDENNEMKLIHSIPYSDIQTLFREEIKRQKCLEFGHSLSDLVGGQIEAGFKVTGFYEDYWGKDFEKSIDLIMPQFIATRALK